MSYRRRLVSLTAIDALVISFAVIFSYFLRFDGSIPNEYLFQLPLAALSAVLIHFTCLYYFKLYKRVWLYASIGELMSIIKAITVGTVLYCFVAMISHISIPRSVYIISWMSIILIIGGSRFLWRLYRDTYSNQQSRQQLYKRRALIVGAGGRGSTVAKLMKLEKDSIYYPVAFVDDDPMKQKLEILGIPVLGTRDDIAALVERFRIEDIIIAMPLVSKKEQAKIIEICKQTTAKLRILPNELDILHGKVSIQSIRNVEVEDLLGRDPVKVDLNGIANYVQNKVVMVTGAGGSIGSELCRQICKYKPSTLILLGHGENSIYSIEMELKRKFPTIQCEPIIADIQDRDRLENVFDIYKPHVIFHAAAHKHVPLMERNPTEAIKNNVFGTKNVAECADLFGAERFVLISTDKAVNPTSIMGMTKRIAEMIIQSVDKVSQTKFVAVRFGNVLGSRGSVIPLFKEQIANGGPVTVTDPEMIRYFMTIPEAVQLVIQAGSLANGGEVFILDMGAPVKIVNLAKDLIRLSGFEPDVDIKVEFTGIRPGEKLFEEILTNEEGVSATKHDRIFVAKPVQINQNDLNFEIMKLEQVKELDPSDIREVLNYLVPAFQSVS